VPNVHAGLAVKFYGTAQAGNLSPDIAEAIEQSGVDVEGFARFQLPLVDLASGRPLGIGVDCLNPFDDTGDGAGDGLQIEAKTFFFLPKGMIVNHGCTSVRPFFAGVGDAGATHMSGSIPSSEFGVAPLPIPACEDVGGVIRATRGFRNTTGDVRLSGAVNLSNAPDEITFSCIFVLNLDPFGLNN
jgi:hypothetical protein